MSPGYYLRLMNYRPVPLNQIILICSLKEYIQIHVHAVFEKKKRKENATEQGASSF